MRKYNCVYIECLSEGYVIHNKGKSKAVATISDVEDYLVAQFKEMISRLHRVDVVNMMIENKVIENCPMTDTSNQNIIHND